MTSNSGHQQGFVLVADEDKQYLDSLKAEAKQSGLNISPMTVRSMEDAKNAISNQLRFLSVIVSENFSDPSGLPLIRFLRVHSPTIPIIVTYTDTPPYSEEEYTVLGIQKLLKKPISYKAIVELVSPFLTTANAVNSGTHNPETMQVDTEFESGDEQFTSIRIEDFFGGSKAIFNFFVRLSPGKYVKIIKKQDIFDTKRLESYLKRGVKAFFLEKTEQARYLNYCEKLSENLINSPKFSNKVKMLGVRSFGEETLNLFKGQGVNAETLQYASSFIANVEHFIKKSGLNANEKVVEFFNDLSAYEHSVAVTMATGVIGKHLKFQGERAVKLLGQASLLHDIGLVGGPEVFKLEDITKLTEEQLVTFYAHPKTGAEVLSQLKIEPVVIQAIEQHHERRDRSGFPNKIGAGTINRIAEIVGICDEFVKLLVQKQKDPYLKIYSHMKNNIFSGFSYDIGEAFEAVFFPNDKEKE